MKLHVGSGPHAIPGWVNLDLNTFAGWERQPDICANVFKMPFRDGVFTHLYSGHLLEHLPFETAHEAVIEMRRVCAPDATLCFVGPCLDKAIATKQPQWLLDEIPRGWNAENDPEGFPHLWTATTPLTREVLERGGLSQIREVPITAVKLPEWPNTAPAFPPMVGMWQCSFLAKP